MQQPTAPCKRPKRRRRRKERILKNIPPKENRRSKTKERAVTKQHDPHVPQSMLLFFPSQSLLPPKKIAANKQQEKKEKKKKKKRSSWSNTIEQLIQFQLVHITRPLVNPRQRNSPPPILHLLEQRGRLAVAVFVVGGADDKGGEVEHDKRVF